MKTPTQRGFDRLDALPEHERQRMWDAVQRGLLRGGFVDAPINVLHTAGIVTDAEWDAAVERMRAQDVPPGANAGTLNPMR